MALSILQYNIISYLLLLPVIINLFNWQSPLVSLIFGGVFTVFQVIIFGQLIASRRPFGRQLGFGALLFILLLIISSSTLYFLWNLTSPAIALIFIFIPIFGSILQRQRFGRYQKQLDLFEIRLEQFRLPFKTWVLTGAYFILAAFLFIQLLAASTSQAILSPFEVVPSSFWALYFVATILLLLIVWDKPLPSLSYFISAAHIFLSVSVALIIYKIGYGFDPFIHQATEAIIAKQGAVFPKTPYYVGQYGLITALHHLLGISVVMLDRLLLPLLTALSLPLFWLEFASGTRNDRPIIKNGSWLALTLLFIPFSSFVVTTPQGLANLLFIWIVVASFPLLAGEASIWNIGLLWATGIASLFVHPLTGVPALIFISLLTYEIRKDRLDFPQWLHKLIYAEFFILGSIALPLLFLLNGYISPQFTTKIKALSDISFSGLAEWFPLTVYLSEARFRSTFFEFAYFIQENIWWILTVAIIVLTYWLSLKRKTTLYRVYVVSAVIFLLNAFFTSAFLDFPELIQYESQAYAARLFSLAFWTMLPLIGLGLIWLFRQKKHPSLIFPWLMLLFIAWIITGNLFASYPRNNRYELGRQYNTSSADIKTVQKIGLKKTDYVVLANQSVSAAAIKEFGFSDYFTTEDGHEFYFYPIPTSSPLYEMYLSMVYDSPSRANAQRAAELSGVETVFFVINEYWDNAETIIELAKLEADEWVLIENGKTVIFTYKFGES